MHIPKSEKTFRIYAVFPYKNSALLWTNVGAKLILAKPCLWNQIEPKPSPHLSTKSLFNIFDLIVVDVMSSSVLSLAYWHVSLEDFKSPQSQRYFVAKLSLKENFAWRYISISAFSEFDEKSQIIQHICSTYFQMHTFAAFSIVHLVISIFS